MRTCSSPISPPATRSAVIDDCQEPYGEVIGDIYSNVCPNLAENTVRHSGGRRNPALIFFSCLKVLDTGFRRYDDLKLCGDPPVSQSESKTAFDSEQLSRIAVQHGFAFAFRTVH